MTNLIIVGATGRMGRALIQAVRAEAQCRLVGATVRPGHPQCGQDAGTVASGAPLDVALTDQLAPLLADTAQIPVIIDFTAPEASLAHAALAAERRAPMVIGTTGFSETQVAQLRHASRHCAIVFSPNTSIGVNIFWHAATMVARLCREHYAIAIDETHHIHKKDAPSGTAKHLHSIVAAAAGRAAAEIPVLSQRRDEVVGDHRITFTGPGDVLTVSHHAKDRGIFAQGALLAAHWVAQQAPGWYGMSDVLGIRGTE